MTLGSLAGIGFGVGACRACSRNNACCDGCERCNDDYVDGTGVVVHQVTLLVKTSVVQMIMATAYFCKKHI